MPRSSGFMILVSIALGVAINTAMALPATANSAGTSANHRAFAAAAVTDSHRCQRLYVHLNGNSPATVSCLDTPPASAGVQPNSDTAPCGDTLNIFVDAYQSGDEICFGGSGFANLTGYQHCHWVWYPWGPTFQCFPWNDDATSWASHNQTGKFYGDTNGNGICASYGANGNGNFTSNPIPNDSLSSICIGSCPPSPTYRC